MGASIDSRCYISAWIMPFLTLPGVTDFEKGHDPSSAFRKVSSRLSSSAMIGEIREFAVLLDALAHARDLPLNLIIVSREDPTSCRTLIGERGLEGRVKFVPPRNDIEFYYAAADAYVGPSLEDTFAQPPAEAMACGLPVIVSSANGTSEIMTHEANGLILTDPTDSATLASMIRRLYQDREFRDQLGAKAASTTLEYTWERNGRELVRIFEEILQRKAGASSRDGCRGIVSRQVADRSDTSSSSPAYRSKRIIGLFPELLGVGGIQEAGRQTVAALDEIARRRGWKTLFLSLNDAPGEHVVSSGTLRQPIPCLRAGEGAVLSRRGESGPG